MKSKRNAHLNAWVIILSLSLVSCAPAAARTSGIPVTGGNGSAARGSPTAPAAGAPVAAVPNSSNTAATLNVGSNPKLGKILVGPTGMTLYVFAGDAPGATNCIDACLQTWPPLEVPGGGSPNLGPGVTGDVSLTTRPDGSSQVAINGSPLYYFTGDTVPGDANGQGFGGQWFALTPDGTRVKSPAAPSPTIAASTSTPPAPSPTPSPTPLSMPSITPVPSLTPSS